MAKKTASKSKKMFKKDDPSGIFVPTGVFIGLGAGFITGNIPAGLFLGLGAGFLAMAIVANTKKKK
jgi:hypothetical protein